MNNPSVFSEMISKRPTKPKAKRDDDVFTMKTPSTTKPEFWGEAFVATPEKDLFFLHLLFVKWSMLRTSYLVSCKCFWC